MAIQKSGKNWVGNSATDLDDYLIAFAECPIDAIRLCKCVCDSTEFTLRGDPTEGAAQRTCAHCKAEHFIADSSEYWEDAEPEEWICSCKSTIANVAVAFSLYKDKESVRWLYIGARCTRCGTLGCFADWKIGYGPSLQLLTQA